MVSPAPTIDSVPGKRGGSAQSLSPEIQKQIDDVRAGRSTTLSLDPYGLGPQTGVPEEIRELSGLRSLYLGGALIETFPSWLGELPNLVEIDISQAELWELPSSLPRVRWVLTPTRSLASAVSWI